MSVQLRFYNIGEIDKGFIKRNLKIGKVTSSIIINILKIDQEIKETRFHIERLKNDNSNPLIIISQNISIGNLAWNVGADSFMCYNDLTKDISQLNEKINRVIYNFNNDFKKGLVINTQNKTYLIYPNEIYFVIADGSYSKIFLERKTITVSKNLKTIYEMIKCNQSIKRFGKSQLINLNKITSLKNNTVFMGEKHKLVMPKYGKGIEQLKEVLIANSL